MPGPAAQKLEEANKRLDEARMKRAAADNKLGEILARKAEKEETEAMEKDAGPPGLSLAEYRKTPKGMREYENWANKKAPADGKPDFGGRKRRGRKSRSTRRGRKSRSTRRR